MIDTDPAAVAPRAPDLLDPPLAGAPTDAGDAPPAGVPDALWRPLTDAERALVRHLPGATQAAPAGGRLDIGLAPGLRASRGADDVLLGVQLQGADGGWRAPGEDGRTPAATSTAAGGRPEAAAVAGMPAEAVGGRLLVADLDALQAAYGRPLPAAIAQSPTALPVPAQPPVRLATRARPTPPPAAHRPPHAAMHRATPAAVHRATPAAVPAAAAAARTAAPATGHLVSARALAEMTVTRHGAAYRASQVVRWSHYDNPILRTPGRPAGASRRWGDAPPATQAAAVDALVRAARAAGLDRHDTALVLAIAHTESGFNPDAAAGTTSASGLGQFVDATGRHYGLGNANRWDVDAQAQALVAHFVDNRALAHARHQGDEYIYKYHHDGPAKDYGGLAISRQTVLPLAARYEALLDAGR
jgi:hypothetical protein